MGYLMKRTTAMNTTKYSGLNHVPDGGGNWFTYIDREVRGVKWAIQMDEVLHKEKTPYQDILVFKSKTFGNVLVLDGAIQCTEKDEFIYSEMMAHMVLNCHPDPKQVLIVGGGDGGVLREVLRHKQVEMVTQVEIDARVIDVCKEYFPSMASGYSDPRYQIIIGDGVDFVNKSKNMFDVVINDCTDKGVDDNSCLLYQEKYWQDLKMTLKPGGVTIQIADTLFYGAKDIQEEMSTCRSIFPSVGYAFVYVPSFCTGQGFRLCSLTPKLEFKNPVRVWSQEERKELGLRYYNQEVHRAAFAIPDSGKQFVYPNKTDSEH